MSMLVRRSSVVLVSNVRGAVLCIDKRGSFSVNTTTVGLRPEAWECDTCQTAITIMVSCSDMTAHLGDSMVLRSQLIVLP